MVSFPKAPRSKLQAPGKLQVPSSLPLPRHRRAWSLVFLWCLLLGTWSFSAPAQPVPPPNDPLMSLMLSQPKIDVASAVIASAWFDPPIVAPGQLSFYRVTFNALEESIEMPEELAAPARLDLRPGAHGQIYQLTGISMEPHTTFNYRARATELGSLIVPQFTVKVYGKPITVPAARLEVTNSPPATSSPPAQLLLEIAATNLYVGQPANVRVLFPGSPSGLMQVPSQVQLTGDGLITDAGAARQRIEAMMRDGVNTATYIYETVIIPLSAGKLSVVAQGFTAGVRFSRIVIMNGTPTAPPTDPTQFVLLESDPVELGVGPLPREGELAGFTGAIGAFTIDPPKLATNIVRVGDPVKLSVAVKGGACFARLVAPPAPHVSDWQVLADYYRSRNIACVGACIRMYGTADQRRPRPSTKSPTTWAKRAGSSR